MLAWLRRLFTTRRDDRELFAYWDGERQRRIDPLVAWRDLWADEHIDLGSEWKVALNPKKPDGSGFYPDEMVDAAEQRLLTLVRRVFDVKAWGEHTPGLTVSETMDLFGDFMSYRTAIKKKRKTSPIESPPSVTTEVPASAASTPPESLPSFEPDCGCTGSASSADEPSGLSKPSAAL